MRGDAALKIRNPKLANYGSGGGEGYVWIELTDVRVYSCYISPNVRFEIFRKCLDDMEDSIRRTRKKVLITGDFNAKSPEWGGPVEDDRGTKMSQWLATLGLVVLNDGRVPTFRRGTCSSYLDLTIISDCVIKQDVTWKVLEEEPLSDHAYVYTRISEQRKLLVQKDEKCRRKWDGSKINREKFETAMALLAVEDTERTAESCVQRLQTACAAASPCNKRSVRQGRREVYWWSDHIAVKRQECLYNRRTMLRLGKKGGASDAHKVATIDYKTSKKELNKAIRVAKDEKWKEILEEVENDVWGQGYRIVTGKFSQKEAIPSDLKLQIAKELFPRAETKRFSRCVEDFEEIREEEVKTAASKIKSRKAPGPDGIPPEAIQMAANVVPGYLTGILNKYAAAGNVPAQWKKARLVLVKKPKREGMRPSDFRPLCLLDTMGKLYEHVIADRLRNGLREGDDLSEKQYGFMKGRSTTDAIKEVCQTVEAELKKSSKSRKLVALIAIDVENAFNSAPWNKIMEELYKKNLPGYLVATVGSYLDKRMLEVDDGVLMSVNAGVPQGSVLGPLLWNVLYDGVLKLPLWYGVKAIAYADDLLITATAKGEQELMDAVNNALQKVSKWMQNKGLKIAAHKTEALMAVGRKKYTEVHFEIENQKIRPTDRIKYLGVVIDKSLSFTKHLEYVLHKASVSAMALNRLMPRLGGAGEKKRRILASVTESIMLYAAPVWRKVLKVEKYNKKAGSVQRKVALRICRGYRTISTEAARVLSRMIPLDLLAEEREHAMGKTDQEKKSIREGTIRKWQERWSISRADVWLHKILPDITKWYLREQGGIDSYMTQAFTSHGSFQKYLHRIGKSETETCQYCTQESDDAEHTLFKCPRWKNEREKVEKAVGGNITTGNLIDIMLQKKENLESIRKYITRIMSNKEEDELKNERRRETDNRNGQQRV